MGNIQPCTQGPLSAIDFPANGFSALFLCDKWATLHVVNPMLIAVWTRNPFFAFFIAFLGEAVEYTLAALFGGFGVFITADAGPAAVNPNADFENLVQSLVEDALIQGGIGVLLGWIIVMIQDSPALLRWRDLWKHPDRFWYYMLTLFGFIVVLPSLLYSVEVGGFFLGINLSYIIYAATALFVYLTSPAASWKGYTPREYWVRWFLSWWIPAFVLQLQNQFDYLGGAAPQSWLWSGVLFLGFFFWSMWRWCWHTRLDFTLTFALEDAPGAKKEDGE